MARSHPDGPFDGCGEGFMSDNTSQPDSNLPAVRAASTGGAKRRSSIWPAALLALAAVLLPVVAGVAIWMLSAGGRKVEPKLPTGPTIADARRALEEGQAEKAVRIVQTLERGGRLPKAERFWPPFILGLVAAHDAELILGDDQRKSYAQAAEFLDLAAQRGFSSEQRAAGLFLLGKCRFHAGRQAASRQPLEEALKIGGPFAPEAHGLLARIYVHVEPHDYARALEESKAYLASPNLEPEQRDETLLEQVVTHLALGDWHSALTTLDTLSKDFRPPDAALWRGKALMAKAATFSKPNAKAPTTDKASPADEFYRQALESFARCQKLDIEGDRGAPEAAWLSAYCYQALHDERATLAQWERVIKVYPNTPESAAAAFEAGEIYSRLGRPEAAIEAFRQYVRAVEAKNASLNPRLSADAAAERLSLELQRLITNGKFAVSLELGKICQPLLDEHRHWELIALGEHAWGVDLLSSASKAKPADAEAFEIQAREHLGRAGDAWAQLARLRFATRDYPELIWQSAQDLLAAREYSKAALTFRDYLSFEVRGHRAAALLGLGEALLSKGDLSEALTVFRQSIELDASSVPALQSRLLAAEALLEKGEPDRAEALLQENLDSDFVTPASQEWRDSLFALGRLLFDTGRFEQSILRLEEAITRYPTAPAAREARYMLALAYWKSARAIDARRGDEAPTEAEKRAVEEMLAGALRYYGQVLDEFERGGDEAEPASWERGMLRNAYFGRASVLFRLARYEAAAQAYLAIINRYQGSPEVLEAYVQIFGCYRRLERIDDARNALQLARATLTRLPENIAFEQATNYTRPQWEQLLDSLGTL
jgi:tetratricopeptide (TPR) repeat protein